MCDEVLDPLQRQRRSASRTIGKRRGAHQPWLCRRIQGNCRRRLGIDQRPARNMAAWACRWRSTAAVNEMMSAACLSLQLAPLMTQGPDRRAGASRQRRAQGAVPAQADVSGEWSGTMNLTEPQAGSDVGASAHQGRGQRRRHLCRITGQKIYHQLGRQRLSPKMSAIWCWPVCPVHGEPGTKGISLFLVPRKSCRTRTARPVWPTALQGGQSGTQDGPARLAHLRDAI